MRRSHWCLVFLLVATSAQSQQQLLRDLPPGQAARIEEFNSVFVQEQTYFASRYGIVQADIDLLRQASEITITPFEDVMPIELLSTSWRVCLMAWLNRVPSLPLPETRVLSLYAIELTRLGRGETFAFGESSARVNQPDSRDATERLIQSQHQAYAVYAPVRLASSVVLSSFLARGVVWSGL